MAEEQGNPGETQGQDDTQNLDDLTSLQRAPAPLDDEARGNDQSEAGEDVRPGDPSLVQGGQDQSVIRESLPEGSARQGDEIIAAAGSQVPEVPPITDSTESGPVGTPSQDVEPQSEVPTQTPEPPEPPVAEATQADNTTRSPSPAGGDESQGPSYDFAAPDATQWQSSSSGGDEAADQQVAPDEEPAPTGEPGGVPPPREEEFPSEQAEPVHATVLLSASREVAEGEDIEYTATLSHQAQTDVVVNFLVDGESYSIVIPTGSFSASTAVPAQPDDVYVDGSSVSAYITTTSGGGFASLTFDPVARALTEVTDTIDTTTVSLTASSAVAEGGQITYTASLTSPAAETPVLVTLSNGASITIPVGASSASTSVAAPGDDVYVDAAPLSAHITSASGGNFESLQINPAPAATQITDTLDASTVSLSASSAVAEGGEITYTASLTSPAAETPVVVELSNGASITIAVGAVTGTTTVQAPDDASTESQTVSASIVSASGGDFENLVADATPATTIIADAIPPMEHAISNIVLYLQDDGGEFYKVKIDEFSAASEEYFDADDELDLDAFIEQYANGDSLVAVTVKAGANGGDAGPGEGELFILDDAVEPEDLPLRDRVPEELTYEFVEVQEVLVSDDAAAPQGDQEEPAAPGGSADSAGTDTSADLDIDWGALLEQQHGKNWVQTLELSPEAQEKLFAGDWTLVVDGETVDPHHLPGKLKDADVQIVSSQGGELESFRGVDKIEWGNEPQ